MGSRAPQSLTVEKETTREKKTGKKEKEWRQKSRLNEYDTQRGF
jgi:hypothetical protein